MTAITSPARRVEVDGYAAVMVATGLGQFDGGRIVGPLRSVHASLEF